jgi:hypothetical protein
MAQVLDVATQQVVEVPDDEVTQLVASGKALLPKGQVRVTNAAGEAATAPVEKAAELFSQGWRYRSEAEDRAAALQAEYGDRPLAAGAAGAARGLTLGLSDAALTASGVVAPETLRNLEDLNPEPSIGGEVLGTAASTLLTAGAATPAALAARGAAQVGERVAAGAGGRALVRLGVEGAVEGGLQGLGRAITDAAQERNPLTAQKALASTAEGALLGLGAGALFGGAADLVTRRGARASGEVAEEAADIADEFPEALPTGTPAPAFTPGAAPAQGPRDFSGKLQSAGGPPSGGGGAPPSSAPPPAAGGAGRPPPPGGFDDVATAAQRIAAPVKAAIEKNPGVFKRVFEALDLSFPDANEWVLRGLDVKKKAVTLLDQKELLDAAPEALRRDPRFAKVKNGKDASELIAKKLEEEGATVRSRAEHLDKLIHSRDQLDVEGFAERASSELIAPLARGTVDQRKTAQRLQQELDALLDRADSLRARVDGSGPNAVSGPQQPVPAVRPRDTSGRFLTWKERRAAEAATMGGEVAPLRLTFAEGEDYKRALDGSLKWDSTVSNADRDALRQLRGMFNAAQEEAAERVSSRLGSDVFEKWKVAKQEFGKMASLNDIAQERLQAAKTANRLFSLTDNIAGAAAGAVGGGLNPVGLAMGLGAALLNKWGRENLPFVMARAMADYERSPGVKQAARALVKRLQGAAPRAAPGEEPLVQAVQQAAQQGPGEAWVMHTVLSGATEYRALAEREGLAQYQPETDEEGQQRAGTVARVEAAAETFDKRADAAAKGLLSGKRTPVKTLPRAEAMARAERVVENAANPEAFVGRVAERVASVGAQAPGLAQDMQETAERAQAFLVTKAPRRPVGPLGDVPALRGPWKPSEMQLAKWTAYVRAVESPASVLEDAASGSLTTEAVEALGAVYPDLLADIRSRVLSEVAAHPKALDYSQRLALGQLLGLQLDASQSPAFIAAAQAAHQAQPAKPQGNASAASPRASKRLNQEYSPADALTQRSA